MPFELPKEKREVISLQGDRKKAMAIRRALWRLAIQGKVSDVRVDYYGGTIDVYVKPSEVKVVSAIIKEPEKVPPVNTKTGEVRVERGRNKRKRHFKISLSF